MSELWSIVRVLLVCIPFVLLALVSKKNNLKPERRHRQGFMPVLAVVFCLVGGFLLNLVTRLLTWVFENLGNWLTDLGTWLGDVFNGGFGWLEDFGFLTDNFLRGLDLTFWTAVLTNLVVIIAYLAFKRFIITLLNSICKAERPFYAWCAKLAYQQRPEDNNWYVKPHMAQGITLMKALYYLTIAYGIVGIAVSTYLYDFGLISSLYYPVFSVIMVSELYFFLDGPRWQEGATTISGERDRSTKICDYTFLRQVLRRVFGDKLLSDNTTVNSSLVSFRTNDEVIGALEEDDETAVEAYGLFMRKKSAAGLDIDQNYLMSGLSLLKGKSVLFNNPFYYDLIPYIFYPMNRAILRRKKVLIVLGRHAIEDQVQAWCQEGLTQVNYIPSLWNIGVLGNEAQDLDVGIITRSSVHDLALHENNADFFAQVDFVMLIEPSRLVATAQIGLNSLIRHCRRDGNDPVFCSSDKNCDGLVDSLSHILMTSLEEVAATNKHQGTSSYMCWGADEEHLQHRMLPHLSRYLGGGTELSFSALKKQVSHTAWYGGDAFPVLDMHWIAKQYYFDLMKYASLPAQQALFDEVFVSSPNLWDARVQENNYLTVEDESYNMYEAKRAFSTRATNQGFINVISTDYLLKDYMAANDGIFDSDSKAIPNIVADYAHTTRNVVYRLLLRMTSLNVTAEDIRKELALINIPMEDPITTLWTQVCRVSQGVGITHVDEETGLEQLRLTQNGTELVFDATVIETQRKYLFRTGEMETTYLIRNKAFINALLGGLQSAQYVAEDETGESQYLGTELWGHIFQKYLPGQFFTFGGKYYEMVGLTLDGRVTVRRAADHITGRPQYRQVRDYALANVTDSPEMGAHRDLGSFKISRLMADITVRTPAYWQMRRYNDFATAKKIAVNGIPVREYNNKQLLRIDFSEAVVQDKATLDTIALLMNEVFRTLYAENQGMIVAVTAGQAEAPLTYSLEGEMQQNSIYLIEDSQLDIGLLVSAERNLSRIFSIVCDYLDWHVDTLEKSKTPPEAEKKSEYAITDEQRAEEKAEKKKNGLFRRIGRKIKSFWEKIKAFFKKLFGRKKKDEEATEGEEPAETTEIPEEGEGVEPEETTAVAEGVDTDEADVDAEGDTVETDEIGEVDEITDEVDEVTGEADEVTGEADEVTGEDTAEEADEQTPPADTAEESAQTPDEESTNEPAAPEADEPAETAETAPQETEKERKKREKLERKAQAKADKALAKQEKQRQKELKKQQKAAKKGKVEAPVAETAEAAVAEETTETEEEHPAMMMSVAPPKYLYSMLPDSLPGMEPAAEETPVEETPAEEVPALDAPAEEVSSEEIPAEETDGEQPEGEQVSLGEAAEGEETAEEEKKPFEPVPPPYHERYYLLYGGEEEPATLNVNGALEAMRQLGFADNSLHQARHGMGVLDLDYDPSRAGSHYCDFCGTELFGAEYDVLADGRERCTLCSRSIVKDEEEFKQLFSEVQRNLTTFFGININAPITVEMVNAKKLHKKLGKTFVPISKGGAGRILGVAIKDKKGNYSLLLENGTPRLSAIMTTVHELTHIWQYLNWDAKQIRNLYGNQLNLQVYEGMAKWVELQYAYLINETATAKREEIITRLRQDEYGFGFLKYADVYPMSYGTRLLGDTPFAYPEKPL